MTKSAWPPSLRQRCVSFCRRAIAIATTTTTTTTYERQAANWQVQKHITKEQSGGEISDWACGKRRRTRRGKQKKKKHCLTEATTTTTAAASTGPHESQGLFLSLSFKSDRRMTLSYFFGLASLVSTVQWAQSSAKHWQYVCVCVCNGTSTLTLPRQGLNYLITEKNREKERGISRPMTDWLATALDPASHTHTHTQADSMSMSATDQMAWPGILLPQLLS